MDTQKLPKYFKKWSNVFDKWNQYLIENKVTALEACISFIRQQKDIDKVVIGVDSVIQLNNILNTFKSKKTIKNFDLKINNKYLLKPSLWQS